MRLLRSLRRVFLGQGLPYAVVGATSVVIDLVVLRVLMAWLRPGHGALLVVITSIGFGIGVLNSYVGNSLWTFRHPLSWKRFAPYLGTSIIGVLLTDGVVYAGTDAALCHWFGYPRPLTILEPKLLAVAVTALYNVSAYKWFVFRTKSELVENKWAGGGST